MRFSFLIGVGSVAAGVATLPTICQSTPPLALIAADLVSAKIEVASTGAGHCQAVVRFKNEAFWPITVDFGQISCLGDQIAEFTLPADAPPGAASIYWLCAGQTSTTCIDGVVANSRNSGDANAMPRSLKGRFGCVEPATALISTTFTKAIGTQAIATTITKTVTGLTTRFPSEQSTQYKLSKAVTWHSDKTDQTGLLTTTNPAEKEPGLRTSVQTYAGSSTTTCNPISCLVLVPLPDTTTAANTNVVTTSTSTITTINTVTATNTGFVTEGPPAETGSSTVDEMTVCGPTVTTTTTFLIQTITVACPADASRVLAT
ncbi:hypothetical protein VFPPC_11343 [Pochonia chlamydosporia 170]|uniref:Uncharacterized protein n=1 Tax=Pochonia chlamydosporia 170 TaxID=1380566 RepID=A0A179EXI3_METCM|nr:hypothetical protein VFPPC_11343 [Pochonia chlamydosporia 170]OAQ57881.2 hypothetical protein VFPPC_11343 [Pochonia chlamydosporia 170]